MLLRLLTATLFVAALAAPRPLLAEEPKANKKKPAIDLDLPAFGELPKGEGLASPQAKPLQQAPTELVEDARYEVVRVLHGRRFTPSHGALLPVGGAMTAVRLSGAPLSTERFQTVVRVRCEKRRGAPITTTIIDERGGTAMSAEGQLTFRGKKGQSEVDYLIEWDPTPLRAGGQFQVQVEIAGQPMGKWPLAFEP